MNVEIKTQSQYKVTNWSGGDTTEIYLYPEDGSYADRDFLFRISSARVEVETSTFTKLSGIQRSLMVLDGKLRLNHNGVPGIWLEAGEQESFLGDENTISEGIATDFNLMLQKGAEGKLTCIDLPRGEKENIALCKQEEGEYFLALYVCGEGQIILSDGYTRYLIKGKETAIVRISKDDGVVGLLLENVSATTIRLIKTEVSINTDKVD